MTETEALAELRKLLAQVEVELAIRGASRSTIANVKDVEKSLRWLEQNSKQQ